jgi:hypothetical protein
MFRTSVAEATNIRRGSNRIEEYEVPDKLFVEYSAAAGTERGDTLKAVVKIIDFVTNPGRKLPMRLPLGADAFEQLKAFHLQQLSDMETFKSWSLGTDVDN